MKKIYLLAASCLLLLAGAVYATSQLKNDSLFNANVEALADVEAGGFGVMCSKSSTSGTYYMKKSKDCNGPFGYYAMDIVAYCQK